MEQFQREDSPLPRKIRRQRSFISRITKSLAVNITSFNETIGYSDGLGRLDIVIPDELKNAWLHLTMGLIFVPHDEVMSENLLVHAQLLIEEGIESIVKSLSTKSLVEDAVILPVELLSLMGLKMLQDSTAGLPDITDTYSTYLESVVSRIPANVSKVSVHRIDNFPQGGRHFEQALRSIARTQIRSPEAGAISHNEDSRCSK